MGNISKSKQLHHIDRKYIFDESIQVINLVKGVFYTIRQIFTQPDLAVRRYLREERICMVKPTGKVTTKLGKNMLLIQWIN